MKTKTMSGLQVRPVGSMFTDYLDRPIIEQIRTLLAPFAGSFQMDDYCVPQLYDPVVPWAYDVAPGKEATEVMSNKLRPFLAEMLVALCFDSNLIGEKIMLGSRREHKAELMAIVSCLTGASEWNTLRERHVGQNLFADLLLTHLYTKHGVPSGITYQIDFGRKDYMLGYIIIRRRHVIIDIQKGPQVRQDGEFVLWPDRICVRDAADLLRGSDSRYSQN